MKALPIIFASITLAAVIVHLVSGLELKTASLPLDHISYPESKPKGVVVLISDEAGWSGREERASEALSREGTIVVGVDLQDYYAALEKRSDECLYLVSDIEDLTRQLHRAADIVDYHPPIVAGIGSGGTLALAIAAQTPESTIAETLAVDPQTAIPLSTVLCTPADKTPASDGMVYGLTEGDLPNPVKVVFSPKADPAGRIHAENLKETHSAVQLVDASDTPETVLQENILAVVAQIAHSASPLALPIVPIDTKPRHDMMAVIFSGDGGWRDIDQQLGAFMKEEGVPVVGVDALRYFWTEKTPEQTAADLSRIIETYRRRWKVSNVVLVGYSFGANILPATYRALPQEDKQAVLLMSLLALSHHSDFEIDVTGWLGFTSSGKYGDPVDDLQQVEPLKIQCIHGLKEADSGCPAVAQIAGAQVIGREGGHHFDGNYRALNRLIVERATALAAIN
jgi:type IV secretory pathway VirJ component